jgi:outer membrane lipoprotein carrier protein
MKTSGYRRNPSTRQSCPQNIRRKIRRTLWIAGAAACLLVGLAPELARASACTAPEQALLARSQQVYLGLSSFQGAFTQEDIVPGAATLKASGTLSYRKPGRMRWEYAPPNEQLLVTDGKTVWLYDPLLESVTEQALSDVTEGTPLKFLLGAGSLTEDFECRAVTLPPGGKDGLTYIELVPLKPIPTLAFLQLGVRPDTSRIETFRMLDTQGGERWVRLTNLRPGVALAPDLFTFKVKPGMDVIKK